jgi:hypothetical protein
MKDVASGQDPLVHLNELQNVSFIFLEQSKSKAEKTSQAKLCLLYLLRAGLLLGLFFDPAYGGDTFIQNVK